MQYSKQDLSKLVQEVEKEFNLLLAKAEESAESALPIKDEESKKEQDAKDKDKEEEKDLKEESAEQKDKKEEEKPKDEESDDESCDYDEEDMEEMHKMYGSMKKGELKAHYNAVKSALEKCGEMQMIKSESKEPLAKSENDLLKAELEEVKKQNKELKESVETLVSAMTSFLTKKAPQRKAITEIAVLEKSENTEKKEINLSHAEITKILSEKAKDQSLSKSDRMAIDNYYLGNRDVSKIRHLLGI